MKKVFRIFSVFALAFAVAGCAKAQLPTASPGFNVNVSGNAPQANASWTGCAGVQGSAANAPGCTYGVFKCTGSSSTCNTTNVNSWTEVTVSAARPSSPAFIDPNATGTLANYAMVTYQIMLGQTGPSNSAPSNIATIQVPGIPPPPSNTTAGTSQQASLVKPALPQTEGSAPQLAFMVPLKVTVKLIPR